MPFRMLTLALAVLGSATAHAQSSDVHVHIEVYTGPSSPAAVLDAPPPTMEPEPAVCPPPPAPAASVFVPPPAPQLQLIPQYAPQAPAAAPYRLTDDRLELRRRLRGTSLGGPIAMFSAGLGVGMGSALFAADGLADNQGAAMAVSGLAFSVAITGLVMWVRRARTRRRIVLAYRAERAQALADLGGFRF